MKILLTGQPKSGKTTLLKAAVSEATDKQGFVTEQIVEGNRRVGFQLVSADGTTALLASVNSASEIRVSKYGVEIDSLGTFLGNLPVIKLGELIYADEIGQMELYSEKFKKLIGDYMQLTNPYVGTISSVYKDDFTEDILARRDVVLLTVRGDNREAIGEVLKSFVGSLHYIVPLSDSMSAKVTAMARAYASGGQYVQLKKLFKNAVRYVATGRITSTASGHYLVSGDHASHHVRLREGSYTCDCKLFKGEGEYAGRRGDCSHIQAVRLTTT